MKPKPKILLIDDAKLIHGVVQARLSAEGMEVVSALSGPEGIALAQSVFPDVILLDVEMPSPDGFEVCRQLKANAQVSNIPVIFLTGAASVEEKVRGLNLGAMDYVTKPFDAAELQARVRAGLRNKELVDLLAHKAMIDGLTALWNRTYLDQRLGEEIAHAGRHQRALSCIMLDVDHFKAINDTYGHGFGDSVLRNVAGVIQNLTRAEDVACRYGGEEFAILARDSDGRAAMLLAERLRAGIEQSSCTCNGETVSVTCSLGVCELAQNADLISGADRALYQSKHSGRNRSTQFSRSAGQNADETGAPSFAA